MKQKLQALQAISRRYVAPVVAGAVALGSVAAHATLDTGVSTAITTAGTDAATAGGLVLTAIVGIFAFVLLRKALR